jgi:hypothetical protein
MECGGSGICEHGREKSRYRESLDLRARRPLLMSPTAAWEAVYHYVSHGWRYVPYRKETRTSMNVVTIRRYADHDSHYVSTPRAPEKG